MSLPDSPIFDSLTREWVILKHIEATSCSFFMLQNKLKTQEVPLIYFHFLTDQFF